MSGDPAATAQALRRARDGQRAPLERLPGGLHPAALADGVAAQRALADLVGADPPAGFKIGATAQRMQAFLGLPGPSAGFMTRDGLHASGVTLPFAAYFRPGVECELAVRLGRDLPPGPCSEAAAREAVREVRTAIEVVENRYADLASFGAPAMVADQMFHAAAVLGEVAPDWDAISLEALRGSLVVDGEVRGEGEGRDLLGGPWRALAWLAGSAEVAAFGGLRAGQVVMLGSVCPTIWLAGPARIEVRFPPLPPTVLTLM